MDAGLWSTLAKRIDSGAFLRSAFPLLLNWLDRGVSRDISSYGCQDGIDRGDGIDAMGPPDIEGGRQGFNDVLAASAESDDSAASRVQVAAATSISNGVYDCLGASRGESCGRAIFTWALARSHVYQGVHKSACSRYCTSTRVCRVVPFRPEPPPPARAEPTNEKLTRMEA